jgi:hypothetical protein
MPSYASSRSALIPLLDRRQFLAGAGAAALLAFIPYLVIRRPATRICPLAAR